MSQKQDCNLEVGEGDGGGGGTVDRLVGGTSQWAEMTFTHFVCALSWVSVCNKIKSGTAG